MFFFKKRSRRQESETVRPGIESLEPRAYFSIATDVALTVPTIPATAVAGQVVNDRVSIDVANNGAATAAGKVEIQLFASTSQTLDASAVSLVNPIFRRLVIGTGRNDKLTYRVREFPSNLQGNYFILAEVTGAIEAVGSSVTQVDLQPPVVNLAPKILFATPKPHLGHTMLVTVLLTNDGNVLARGTLDILFEESDNNLGTNPVQVATLTKHIKIFAGRHAALQYHVPLALGGLSGNLYVEAVVDPMQVFANFSNTDVYQTAVSIS